MKRESNIGYMTLKELYYRIWVNSNRKSYISELPLSKYYNSSFQLNIFAHVLPKAQNKYPHFKFYAGNIVLLTPDEHFYWDTPQKERGKEWQKLERLEEKLREEYEKHFPKKVGLIINYKYSLKEVAETVGNLNREFFS